MDVVFGTSNKGKPTLIYRNFEYVKECENPCGTTSWRCRKYQTMKCKAPLVTALTRATKLLHWHGRQSARWKRRWAKWTRHRVRRQRRWPGTRQSGADGVAETKNAVESCATWTTESVNGRWWTAGVTSCSNWSSLRDTEHVHGHGALWFGS